MNVTAVDIGLPVQFGLSYHPTNLYPGFAVAVEPCAMPLSGFNNSDDRDTVPPSPTTWYLIVTLIFQLPLRI
mgnify:CR=1 FL=1